MKRAKSLWSLINPQLLRAWRLIKYRLLRAGRRINDLSQGLLRVAEAGMVPLAIGLLIAVIVISVLYWDSADEIRNVGLIVAAIVALPIAIWRSRVAERQADIAQQGVLNERYQKSAEMLGSGVLSVRLGGIAALERLAFEHPTQYHVEVMKLLFAFIRQPIEDSQARNFPVLGMRGSRQDVQAAVDAVRVCRSQNRTAEANSIRWIDLSGADLRQADLSNIDLSVMPVTSWRGIASRTFGAPNMRIALSHTDLSKANLGFATMPHCLCEEANFTDADFGGAELREALFVQANLRNASLTAADLAGAAFLYSNLRNVSLRDANLSGAEFAEESPGEAGLTQRQLDEACADPEVPPRLVDMVDAETKQALEWRGKECENEFRKLKPNPFLWSR